MTRLILRQKFDQLMHQYEIMTLGGKTMYRVSKTAFLTSRMTNMWSLFIVFILLTVAAVAPAPAQTLPSGTVAAYGFNEGTGTVLGDASGNLNTGTRSGASWTTSGRYGSALSFNGTSNLVNVNDAPTLDLTTAMTLEAWVYPTISSGSRPVVFKETTGGLAYALYANDSALRPAVYINTGGSDIIVRGRSSLPLNTWTHLSATYDGTTLILYVNGIPTNGASATGTISVSAGLLRIGGSTVSAQYFRGRIDEVRIYNRALAQSEILLDMNTPIPVDTVAPAAPSNLTATVVSGTRIDLSWTASTDFVGVTGYRIERCQGVGCTNFTQIATTTATTYSNTRLSSSTYYSYRIRATDAALNLSAYSDPATAMTVDVTAPTTPSGLAATSVSSTQINLTWTASTDNVGVTGYRIERCQGASCSNFVQVATSAANTYSDATLLSSTAYRYRVRATDAAGNLSSYSNIASATTLTPPDTTAPTAPSGLVVTAVSSTQINLTWTASTDNVGVTGYRIERCQGAGCANFAQIATATGTTYSNTGLTEQTSYSYRVLAYDAAGNLSPHSNVATAETPETTPPTAPAGLSATAVSGTQIDLTWTASTDNVGVTGYLIERCQGVGCTSFAQIATTTATTYNNTGLTNGTSYSYRVRATDAAGNLSPYSNTSTAATPDTAPPTVTAFTIPATATSLTVPISSLSATDNVAVTGYLVNESAATPPATAAGWSATVPASYTFATAGSKTLYAWAKDAANNVSASRSATVTITLQAGGPEPAGWYAGDPHVHRSCGGAPESKSSLYAKMSSQNLAVISLLADMGNGEVQDPVTDLPLVNGQDDPVSTSGRIVHWDAEWHWDAVYTQFPHQALGGHVVALGLTEAHQIWEEYTHPIFNWAHQQNAIAGFVHMQYLDNGIPQSLDCCTPLEYPVEVALGSADFISEDVNGSDTAIQAYYRLLNTGFRPALTAGTDYPCGVSELGSLLTYVQVAGGQMTYRNWIDGIKGGRTAVSRNGHNEFLSLTVNNTATPGDEINLTAAGSVPVTIAWTASQDLTGTIELVRNGVVVASRQASVSPGAPETLTATVDFSNSGWLAARRMGANGHQVHTGSVFVTVNNAPVRASVADAEFYVQWIDNLLEKTSPGGAWSSYFVNSRDAAQARYQAAKAMFQQIAVEAGGLPAALSINTASLPAGTLNVAYSATLAASGGTQPYTWSIASGALPPGLTLNSATGAIAGTPTVTGDFNFTAQVTDAANPAQNAGRALSITISVTLTEHTIWPASTIPGLVDGGPDSPVELGVKFRADSNGYVKGIRFYKASANTGAHVGNLWSSTGTLLATATFTNETASGWQQVIFSSPVAITANTVYVASYHAGNGHYSADINYFATAGVDSPPLHALANGVSGGNGVYAYGSTSTFPTQTWNTTNYWVDVVFSATPPAALTSITVTPANPTILSGATQQFTATGTYSDGSTQNITGPVTWASSNTAVATVTSAGLATAVNPGSAAISATLAGVTGSTTLTVQVGPLSVTTTGLPGSILNAPYSATLAANGGTRPYTWAIASGSLPPGLTLNTSTGAVTGTSTTVGTYSFTARVTDSANPAQNATGDLSITISDQPVEYTIWPGTAVPGTLDDGPDNPVEVGVRFWSDVNGAITGIRFYKASTNTGTHVGNLWTNTGTLLATATFANETVSGWQQVNFSAPVAIAANTVYVASYHTTVGHYSADEYYFAGRGFDSMPLHAPADGVSGINGVYAYGPAGTFPNLGWRSSNDWVDVVFTTTEPLPTLTSVVITPANPSIQSGASQPFTATGIYSNGITQNITSLVTWASSNTSVATISSVGLARAVNAGSATISAALNGITGVTSLTVTPPPPPPTEGPGGPVLIISNAANPFSRYYAEVLRAEGFNAFSASDISQVSAATLSAYDVAILGEMPLSSGQVTMLTDWVNGGGRLIAMRPDKQLSSLLGLSDDGVALSDAYILVNTFSGPGAGIVDLTMQFHGTADRYSLSGATALATLYVDASTATSSPAVTLRSVGTGGGQAAAFTYDLARSIVYTRQGNPAWSGQERDGVAPMRSDDLFYPDWVNLNKVAIPQADEQQRLLANLILQMNMSRKPLPRFWYLPRGLKAAVVMTGDDHATGGTAPRFDSYIAAGPTGCSVENWECIRSTSYVEVGTPLTNAQAESYSALGFEVGIHLNTGCADWTPFSLEGFFIDQLASWTAKYSGIQQPSTHRAHCIAWSDYTTMPQVELSHAIRFDTNYYYWPGGWIADRPGFFTGSGMPMRFATSDGTMIDVYQAATQMTDESNQSYPFTVNALLDKALGPEGYYGVFTVNAHTDAPTSSVSDAVISSARARGVPVVSAHQMLTWLDGRNGSSFGSLSWNGTTLSFTVTVGAGANGLQILVPVPTGLSVDGVTLGGSPVTYALQTIKGVQYAVFSATAGTYQVVFTVSGV